MDTGAQGRHIGLAFFFGLQFGCALMGDCVLWLARTRAIELHMGPRLMTVSALLFLFVNFSACIGFLTIVREWWLHRRRTAVA